MAGWMAGPPCADARGREGAARVCGGEDVKVCGELALCRCANQ